MRLAFIIFKYFPHGGAQKDLLAIAHACHLRGHSITLFCFEFQGEQPPWLEVKILASKELSNHSRAKRFQELVQRVLSKDYYDGVIGFNRMAGLDIYFAADDCLAAQLATRNPLIRWLPRAKSFAAMEKATLGPHGAKTILTLTSRQEEEFYRFYGCSPERYQRLPPLIPDLFQDAANLQAKRQPLRQEFAATAEELVLVQIASSYHTKGVDRSLRALAALPSEQRPRLWLVGAEKHPYAMRHLAKKLGVAQQVQFCGGRDDVPAILYAADLMIHPARKESAGAVLVEALAAGLTVISSGICGYAEHIRNANAGIVLDEPFRQAQLDQSLAALLADAPRRQAYAARARAYVDSHAFYLRADIAATVIEKSIADKVAARSQDGAPIKQEDPQKEGA